MCVLVIAETTRLTKAEVKKMWQHNPDGGGIAWYSRGQVIWRKGLSLFQMTKLARSVPLPYVAHFRLASAGGPDKRLCHPFPLKNGSVPLDKRGRTKGMVAFHNGHLQDWVGVVPERPTEPWSDTRALFWTYAVLKDPGIFLRAVVEEVQGRGRYVVMAPETILYYGEFATVRPGLLASNLFWQNSFRSRPLSLYDWHRRYSSSQEMAEECSTDVASDDFDTWLLGRQVRTEGEDFMQDLEHELELAEERKREEEITSFKEYFNEPE